MFLLSVIEDKLKITPDKFWRDTAEVLRYISNARCRYLFYALKFTFLFFVCNAAIGIAAAIIHRY